ncbi:hypothetical protein QBC39DRAFT_290237 [Podospora conica]|nr:hypothetical protein QBC39DRAFT_290237 [Schizothecium conicum]
MSIMTTTFVALAALLGASNAHMIMNTPTPYNHHKSSPLVQVDPLGPSLPFPCQGLSTIESTTPLTAGATQRVAFTGGAQHGGGSCQFSVTYEYPPPADKSKWKTIYTLIGGCPVSAAGNLPAAAPDADGRADSPQCGNDSGVECVREFRVPIPKGLPSGNATFAWTWFNKVGNRELYMNCAPVTIAGGAADTTFFDALPEMFVANVAGECTTGNGVLNIPNPGKFGRVLEQPTPGSEGSCPKAAGVPVFEGDAAGAAPAAPPTTFLTATRPASSAAGVPAAPATTFPGGGSSPCKPASPPAPAPVAPNAPVRQTGEADVGGDAQSCSVLGDIVCIGDSQFGICDGTKAVAQDLSAGMTCSGGVIARV